MSLIRSIYHKLWNLIHLFLGNLQRKSVLVSIITSQVIPPTIYLKDFNSYIAYFNGRAKNQLQVSSSRLKIVYECICFIPGVCPSKNQNIRKKQPNIYIILQDVNALHWCLLVQKTQFTCSHTENVSFQWRYMIAGLLRADYACVFPVLVIILGTSEDTYPPFLMAKTFIDIVVNSKYN